MVLVILYRRLTSSLLSWQVIGFFFFALTLQLMSEFLWAAAAQQFVAEARSHVHFLVATSAAWSAVRFHILVRDATKREKETTSSSCSTTQKEKTAKK